MIPPNASTPQRTPVRVFDDVVDVSVGDVFAFAIRADGSLWRIGFNYDYLWGGMLDDDDLHRFTPVKKMEGLVAISLGTPWIGGFHVVAIKTDGKFWTWGSIGDNITENLIVPVRMRMR